MCRFNVAGVLFQQNLILLCPCVDCMKLVTFCGYSGHTGSSWHCKSMACDIKFVCYCTNYVVFGNMCFHLFPQNEQGHYALYDFTVIVSSI